MADEADAATARMEIEEELRRRSLVVVSIPQGTGNCQWCDVEIAVGPRWCSTACRDDEERYGK